MLCRSVSLRSRPLFAFLAKCASSCPRIPVTAALLFGAITMLGLCARAFPALCSGADGLFPPAVSMAILAPLFTLLLVQTLRRFGFDWGLVLILLFGVLLWVGYLTYTDVGERNYDTPEQFKYISFVRAQHRLPSPTQCMVCYHPPLYYALAALWSSLALASRLVSVAGSLQFLSLLLSIGFVVFCILTIRHFAEGRRVSYLAAALLVFWPATVLQSVRVHNDVLVSLLMAAALYFFVRWRDSDRTADLCWTAALTGLSVLTKSSGYVLVAMLLGWILVRQVRFWSKPQPARQLPTRAVSWALSIVALSVGLSLLPRTASHPALDATSSLCSSMLGNLCDLRRHAFSSNRPFQYLYFDVRGFLTKPFLVVEQADTGRSYFWNCLLKSSLFGTHNSLPDGELCRWPYADLAMVLNGLLFGMVALSIASCVFLNLTYVRRRAVLVAATVGFLLMLVAFRAVSPFPHHTDFRHVSPLLVPFALFYAEAMDRSRQAGRVTHFLGYGLALSFVLLSVLFFLPLRPLAAAVAPIRTELSLGLFGTVREAGTPPDRHGSWLFGGRETLVFRPPPNTTAARLDLSVSSEDRYQVSVVGDGASWSSSFGPSADVDGGLERWVLAIVPPVRNVRVIELRPLAGDGEYALGHLVVAGPAE